VTQFVQRRFDGLGLGDHVTGSGSWHGTSVAPCNTA
jgi:hypothetical protein